MTAFELFPNLPQEMKSALKTRLTNKLFGVLNEFEKSLKQKGKGSTDKWERLLDSIIIEFMGLPEETHSINYYVIMTKLSTLRLLKYRHFRDTILDIVALLDGKKR